MKILIIDDDPGSLQSLGDTLELGNYESTLFENPVRAIEDYKNNSYDVVITDFKMPEMNGIEVLKQLKEYKNDAIVIVLTGYAAIENAIDAVNNGAYAFFRKPLDIEDLIKTLERIEDEINGKLNHEKDLNKIYQEYRKLKNLFDSLKKLFEELNVTEKEKVINA